MSKWLTIEDDLFMVVIPQTDIKPHSTDIEDKSKHFELAGASCPCKPRFLAGNAEGIYAKPLIIHNSFEDMQKIEQSLAHSKG